MDFRDFLLMEFLDFLLEPPIEVKVLVGLEFEYSE